jgi:Leucine-rich repeat (LRR) protein
MQASRNGLIYFLPEEIIRKILFLLPNCDLKNATAVCKRWQDVGSEPKLWRGFRLCINYKSVGMILEMMKCQRLRGMQSVKFLAWFVPVQISEAVIREVSLNSEVEELVVRGNGFTDFDPNLLSSSINKMRRVLLTKTRLSQEQVEVLFNDMEKKTRLIELDIRENDLSKVDPNIIANCVNKLRKATLMKTYLSMRQKQSILKEMEKKTNLEMLDITQNGILGHLGWGLKKSGLSGKVIY